MKRLFVFFIVALGLSACAGDCAKHEENAKAPVFFKHNSVEIMPESLAQLDDGLIYMTGHRFKTIELNGYADETGEEAAYNMDLSKRRVEKVRDYLVNKGVAESRIKTSWHGTERGHPYRKHRRVDITVK